MKYIKSISQKFQSWWKDLSWQEVALLVLIFIIGFPSLFVSWMLVDDGVSILMAQKISSFLTSFNFAELWDLFIEKESGRFRPAYWLFHWFSYLVGGKNPLVHHFIHFVISATTVFLIFSIIRILTLSKSSALLGSSLFLLTSLNIENWYRLGPQEPMLVFYLAVSLYFLVKNLSSIQGPEKKISNINLLFSILPLIPAYFTKETSLALMPFSVFLLMGTFLVKDRKRKTLWLKNFGYFLIANLILSSISLVIILFLRTEGFYSSYYVVSLFNFITRGRGYLGLIIKSFGFFSWIFLFSFLSFSLLFIKKRKFALQQFLQISFSVGFLSFFIIQLPWKFILGRYLEPALFFLVIVCGFEAARLFEVVKRYSGQKILFHFWINKRKAAISPFPLVVFLGFILPFLWFVFVNGPLIFNYGHNTLISTQSVKKVLAFVAQEAPRDGRVFLNLQKGDATIEFLFESKLHFDLFYHRPDLSVDYLDEDNIRKLEKGHFIINAFTGENFWAFKKGDLERIVEIENVKTVYHRVALLSFYPPSDGGLLAREKTLTVNKILKFVIFEEYWPKEWFFKFSIDESKWKIYKVSESYTWVN